jgi:hypothetical protein
MRSGSTQRCVPFLAERLIALLVYDSRRDELLGDLEEEYRLLAERRDVGCARRWYWKQTFISIQPMLRRRASDFFFCGETGSSYCSHDAVAPNSLRIGYFFFAFTCAWIAAVAWLKQPDPTGRPANWPTVNLPDGADYTAYLPRQPGTDGAVSPLSPAEGTTPYLSAEFAHRQEDRFLLMLFGVPLGIVMGALMWLGACRFRFQLLSTRRMK